MVILFARLSKTVMNFWLHLIIKNSEITNLSLELKEANGKYILDVKSTVLVATKGEQVRKYTGSRNLLIVFFVSLAVWVALALVGILLPDPIFGRTLVYLSEFPAILVNIISTRYIIRNIS
jgi:hypothetical protein